MSKRLIASRELRLQALATLSERGRYRGLDGKTMRESRTETILKLERQDLERYDAICELDRDPTWLRAQDIRKRLVMQHNGEAWIKER